MAWIMRNNLFVAGMIGLASTLVMGVLWGTSPDLFLSWERTTYDLRLRWQGGGPVHPGLVLISRDVESEEAFGKYLWPRTMFARVIEALGNAGARVIALDFVFPGESPQALGGSASDQALADATHQAGNVVLPLMLKATVSEPNSDSTTNFDHSTQLEKAISQNAPTLSGSTLDSLVVAQHAGIHPALMEKARSLGHIVTFPDEDGVHRKYPLLVNAGGHALPALSLAMVAVYLNVSHQAIEIHSGEKLVLPQGTWPDGTKQDLTVPLDKENNLLIHYAGQWLDWPFPNFSFRQVWEMVESGDLATLHDEVGGKMVMVLPADSGKDWRLTPLDLRAPGGFIHANVVNSLLLENALKPVSTTTVGFLGVVLATVGAFILITIRKWKGFLGVVVLAIFYVGVTIIAIGAGQLVLPVVAPLGALIFGVGGALGWINRTATHQVEHLESEILEAKQELKELSGTRELLVSRESKVEELEEELESLRSEAGTALALNQQSTHRIQEMETELETLKSKAGAASEVSQQSAQRIQEMEAELEMLKSKVGAVADEKQNVIQRMESLQAEMAQAESETGSARQRIRELEAQLARVTPSSVPSPSMSSVELEALRQEADNNLNLITCDERVLGIVRDLKKAAKTLTPILILGETGTGKEVLARAAHTLSGSKGEFVGVNVATLSKELVGSELFGHERGAFTGAHQQHKGFFEKANKGTIFLDEIGELTPEIQTKLLRVLQEKAVERVGGKGPIPIDVRVVSATNRDLRQGVAEGWFREDLYFRLRVMEFRLPPLRERRADLALLATRFVQGYVKDEGLPELTLSQSALAFINRWAWPGNIRELQNRLKRAVILAEGNHITEENLQYEEERSGTGLVEGEALPTQQFDVKGDLAVLQALRHHAFDIQSTAQDLNWDRSTVTLRLKGLCFATLVEHHGDRQAAAAALAGAQALTRVVEVKVKGYLSGLMKVVGGHSSLDSALADYQCRCKNLPDRYLPAVKSLIRSHFEKGLGS